MENSEVNREYPEPRTDLESATILIIAAIYERTEKKYGKRSARYVHMEVGHAAQNVLLQAVSLKLGAGIIGAFRDGKIKSIIRAKENEEPLYMLCIGTRGPT